MLLKHQTLPWLGLFVIAQMAVLLGFIAGWPTTPGAAWSALTIDWTTTGVGFGVGLVALVLNAILTSELKAVLVFLRWNDPLPGSRAFSELAASDPRIDQHALAERHEFPTQPGAQNHLWYRIYQRHEGKDAVRSGHLDYLLFRDLTALTALFATLGGSLLGVLVGWGVGGGFFAVNLAVFSLLRWMAARKGERFVQTVLAIESAGATVDGPAN